MSFMDKTKTTTSTTSTTGYNYSLGEQDSVGGTYGWICPVCGRGVAPGQKYCGCRPQPTPIYPAYPVYPYWWYKVTCNTTGSTPDASTVYTSNSTSTKVEV